MVGMVVDAIYYIIQTQPTVYVKSLV